MQPGATALVEAHIVFIYLPIERFAALVVRTLPVSKFASSLALHVKHYGLALFRLKQFLNLFKDEPKNCQVLKTDPWILHTLIFVSFLARGLSIPRNI